MPNHTDDRLTEIGLQIAKDASIQFRIGLEDFNHNFLPPTPRDDLANLALHGPEGTDYDRSFLSFLIKNMIDQVEASVIMTRVMNDKPGMLFGKRKARKSCPKQKNIPIRSLYTPQRRATTGETASLMQIIDLIDMEDFVSNVRNCSMSVDIACKEFKLAVERFAR